MKRRRLVYALDLLVLALVAAEVLLIWSSVISVEQGILAGVVIEVLLVALGLRHVFAVTRAYQGRRAAGVDGWAAFTEGMGAIMPLPVARVVALEPRMWHCLYRWVTRRPLPPGSYTYHHRSPLGPLLLVVALTTPAEILLVELLVPWGWVRVLFLVTAVYACFWIVAYYASLATLPHRLLASAVEIRYGATVRCLVPYAAITGVEAARLRPPRRSEGLRMDPDANVAWLVAGGRTDLTLALDPPPSVETFGGLKGPVSTIHLAVDQPTDLAAALLEKLGEVTRRDVGPPSTRRHPGPAEAGASRLGRPAAVSPASAPPYGSSRPSGSEAEASSER